MFSKKKDRFQNTNNTTRGGQVWAHQIRMGWQVFKTSSLVALLPAVLVWSWSCISNVSGLGFYLWILSFWAEIKLAISGVFFNGIATISFFKGGVWVMRDARSFVHNPYVQGQVWKTESAFGSLLNVDSIFWGLVSFFFFVIVCLVFFKRKGGGMEEEVVMEGQSIAPKKEVARAVRKEGASALEIAPGLPIPKNSETKHFMILGTTGYGKTNCILGLLNQARALGQRAVILDTNGGFVSRYYDPERGDVILNPFDDRAHVWQLWEDCKTTSDFDQFAAALIPAPKGGGNPVWHKNAREIISTTAEKLAIEKNFSIRRLIDLACWLPLSKVKNFYVGTPVEALMLASGKAEEVVHSVRMQMTDSMKRLSLLPEEGSPFSISKWVREEKKGFLFISASEADRASLGTIMKFWVSLSIQSLLRRGEDFDHRLWFVLDELFALEGGGTDELFTLLREGRKYGGCAVLGFQSLAGLEKVYGSSGMREVVSLCNTKVILKTPEPHTAQYISQCLGEKEIIQSNESLSMGANTIRDGVNVSAQMRVKASVSKSDIIKLAPLEAFVALSGSFPVCKVKFPLNKVAILHNQESHRKVISVLKAPENEDVSENIPEEKETAA